MSSNPFQDTQPYAPTQSQPTGFDLNAAPRKSGFPWGCILGGCLGVFIFGLLLVGGASYLTYRYVSEQIAKYTSDHPVDLPTVNVSEDEIAAIEKKLEDFRNAFESGENPQELVITVDEINALLAKDDDMKGHVYVKIVDGNLRADVSAPLDGFPGGSGRYFNGSATLHVELDNGVLIANVVEAEVNGNTIPDEMLEAFKKENLAKGMYDDPNTARTLSRCESLRIESDRIILKVRQKPADPPNSPGSEADSKIESAPPSTSTDNPATESKQ